VDRVADPEFLRVPFQHPLWVLFSSGTTGAPKGIVHGHGGILVESLKQMALHWDLGPDDTYFWFTSPSWVMWNLQVSVLAVGAAVVCYDGSPTYPDARRLWQIVASERVTCFGMSPGYLQATRNAGVEPAAELDLSALRAMGSTGSPLPRDLHAWAAREIPDVPLFSFSGGTDIAGAFCGGAPTVPIWPGELSVRCLGVAVEAWSEAGLPLVDAVGELVVTAPMPSMPVAFWDDPGDERYAEAYFSTYPGVWRHGDWISVSSRGTVVVHGRSDSTLNRNGVRMGSGDIYAAVESLPEVEESLVIGAELGDGRYWMPLFVRLTSDARLDDELRARIIEIIRARNSARHVPDEIIVVPGIPHTRTGKKLEVPVKRILQGANPGAVVSANAVDEPGLLEVFAQIAASRAREV
jgi:acetoacetyl-CoA synthetase